MNARRFHERASVRPLFVRQSASKAAAAERIAFAPGLLTTKIAYTNRPSGIQQVISFEGHRSKRR